MALFLARLAAFFLLADGVKVQSKDGRLEYTLTVEPMTWHVPFKNISFLTRSYNGMIPGPEIEVHPGDLVELKVVNKLGPNQDWSNCKSPDHQYKAANATNLHIHGIYDDALHDNTFLCMESGQEVMYSYLIEPRSTTSTFFYHPHMDGSSAMQLYGGMAGAFIITNTFQDARFGLDKYKTMVCVLQMLNFDPAASDYIGLFMANQNQGAPTPTSELPLQLNNPENYSGVLLLTNGEYAPTMDLRVGERGILRFINAMSGSDNIAHLAFQNPGCALKILAYDGVYLNAPRPQSSVFIPAGGRADISVVCAVSGKHCLTTTSLDSGMYGPFGGLVESGHDAVCFDVAVPGVITPELTKLPGPPMYYNDKLKDNHPDGNGSITLSNPPGDNVIDGFQFNGSIATEMKHGSLQEWQLYGGELPLLQNYHPYHQHNTHFQIMSTSLDTSGIVAQPGDWRDTIPLYKEMNHTVRFVAPFKSLVMVHCHILKHEDLGMMTLWNVTEAPDTYLIDDYDVTVRHGLHEPMHQHGGGGVPIWLTILLMVVFCIAGVIGTVLVMRRSLRKQAACDDSGSDDSGEQSTLRTDPESQS